MMSSSLQLSTHIDDLLLAGVVSGQHVGPVVHPGQGQVQSTTVCQGIMFAIVIYDRGLPGGCVDIVR